VTHPNCRECELKAALPATLEAAEEFLAEFRRSWRCRLKNAGWFGIELLLREALANAVKHGSHGDSAKQVRCVLRLSGRRLVIAVRDEGDGFDWRAAGCGLVGSLKPSGLGIPIYREYATRVRFNSRGNAVTIVKQF
jgi:serine/threonine-protein kinase RsbW